VAAARSRVLGEREGRTAGVNQLQREVAESRNRINEARETRERLMRALESM